MAAAAADHPEDTPPHTTTIYSSIPPLRLMHTCPSIIRMFCILFYFVIN
jgi:hypothetical protein